MEKKLLVHKLANSLPLLPLGFSPRLHMKVIDLGLYDLFIDTKSALRSGKNERLNQPATHHNTLAFNALLPLLINPRYYSHLKKHTNKQTNKSHEMTKKTFSFFNLHFSIATPLVPSLTPHCYTLSHTGQLDINLLREKTKQNTKGNFSYPTWP